MNERLSRFRSTCYKAKMYDEINVCCINCPVKVECKKRKVSC